ncbi:MULTISPECIES: ABC transporter ATP-binding protein [Caproicibacterium]|uniref:ABC transporter ATP-binding protein n=1 Tax=Caproicibacterium argilliputei TaxID=3030016 RepID=A0AA97H1F0_9FIRM|nr:ABC transporter ATP-binding protein [Caproicibacterium argilliputei]WOC32521.1 ABC transporter ATP-binding protein [Caproicibacterium argilliputei]
MIVLENITKQYNIGKPNQLTALDGINLQIDAGEMIAVMGASGAGKSTLAHILACLESPTSGSYHFDGEDVSQLKDSRLAKVRNQGIGILLQNFALLQEDTALGNCEIPLYFNKTRLPEMKEKALQALKKVGIEALAKQKVGTMSGGQQQRVALARAIVCDPKLVIADEPTGALDSATADEVMEQMKILNQGGTTMLIVTHDQTVASRCSRILHMKDGHLH